MRSTPTPLAGLVGFSVRVFVGVGGCDLFRQLTPSSPQELPPRLAGPWTPPQTNFCSQSRCFSPPCLLEVKILSFSPCLSVWLWFRLSIGSVSLDARALRRMVQVQLPLLADFPFPVYSGCSVCILLFFPSDLPLIYSEFGSLLCPLLCLKFLSVFCKRSVFFCLFLIDSKLLVHALIRSPAT